MLFSLSPVFPNRVTYKRNAFDQAIAPRAQVWRKKARVWLMDAKRSEGGNWRKGAKTSSGYIL